MSDFVLEIGVEELPARFLSDLEKELSSRFEQALTSQGVRYASLAAHATPRRAAVLLNGVEPRQAESEEVVTGPPVRAAYDAGGRPTPAAEGFAKTHGVTLKDLHTVQTPKGEYLALRKKIGGAPASDLLAAICPAVINALPFPKRMRWGSKEYTFARPLRWLLALFDEAVLSFSVAGLESGRLTHGHRVHGPGPFSVAAAADYLTVIKERCHVVLKAEDRQARIIEDGNRLAAAIGGTVLWNDALLEEVCGLTEYPVPLIGDIARSYLELPAEVLLTSMQSHQKSFGIADPNGPDGALLPHCLTVLNLNPPDPSIVKHGWERVLRARLEDARFFWNTDRAASFDSWLEKLDHVTFLAPLGSIGDKTRRIEQLCAWLAKEVGFTEPDLAARAGRISKADLVSGMVGEFDTLQGIMGGIYARGFGEPEAVGDALAEQYLPTGPASPVPASKIGAILSIADKADTLAGCFGLAMIPTGAADPYALRRCSLGITRIVIEHSLDIDIPALFAEARRLYGNRNWKLNEQEAQEKLIDFFTGRVRNLLISNGYGTLEVDAALNADSADVRRAAERLAALAEYSKTPCYVDMATTFKRAANIIRKQGNAEESGLNGAYAAALLLEPAEKALAARLEAILPLFDSLWQARDHAALFTLLGELRPAVDDFFNGVMVMDENPDLRRNRLNLLFALVDRMGRLADFSALQF